MMKSTTILGISFVVCLLPAWVFAAPCSDESDCEPGESCESGECVSGSGAPFVECTTTNDCGSFEQCQDGMCVPAREIPDKPEGSCTQDSDCTDGQICVSNTCEDKGDYCKTDSDCGQFETCEFTVPDAPGGDGTNEWGDCSLDPEQIPVDPTCSSVCQTLSNCPNIIEDDPTENSGSSSGSATDGAQKADEATEKAEFVAGCTLSCSYFIASNQAVAEFQATALCVQQHASSCEAIETNCMDEIEAADARIDSLDDKSAGGNGGGGTTGEDNNGNQAGTTGTGTGDDERGGCVAAGATGRLIPWLLLVVFGVLWRRTTSRVS
ncbi:MAG: hypothetical protein HUU55_10760 [Myxococcales bacterium]|nr:hypothetical protein [Myxococcales bacterium]